MCGPRRRDKDKKKQETKIKAKTKKKRGCCNRCIKAIIKKTCGWCCRRIKRCVKRKVFGVRQEKLANYQVGGVNLDSLKDFIKAKIETKKSVNTLYKNKLSNANVSLKNAHLLDGSKPAELIKKFSITGSKINILNNMMEDYNKGKLSLSWIGNKSALDVDKLDKTKLNTMLRDYDAARKKKILGSLKNFNAVDIKQKFANDFTGSKEKLLERMVDDVKQGKVSLSMLPNKSKLDVKKLTKDDMAKMLKTYEEGQKKKGFSFLKQHLQPMIEEAKKKFSYSDLAKFKNF